MSCCSASRDGIVAKEAASHFKENVLTSTSDFADELVEVPGQTFAMGSDESYINKTDGESPVRNVTIESFLIGAAPVTNLEYSKFVLQTGYKTEAETEGWSFVFAGQLSEKTFATSIGSSSGASWWIAVPGASWEHPLGLDSSWTELPDHPAVHVSLNDAIAYSDWIGARLPNESEWEAAARGGLSSKRYPWGDDLVDDGVSQLNKFTGNFPYGFTPIEGRNLKPGTTPVKTFAANNYGLYDMVGNIWEWTSSKFGETKPDAMVIRGGSFLCHDSYCNRYRVSARSFNTASSSTSNTGFRIAKDRVGFTGKIHAPTELG